jgi:hypothetical protein
MTEPGWYSGFLCRECGGSLPVERRDRVSADTGARPIAIGAWEIKCPACGFVDNYGVGRSMTRMLIEKTDTQT